ncbi:mitochondrial Rho GTPase 2 [Tanacetum coccineum]
MERIFILYDHDMDGALNDRELNEFQCFSRPLQSSEIVGFKIIVWERVLEGVNKYGITLVGFLFLHALMIEKGQTPMAWTVLHKFGYNNNIELCKENINVPSRKDPDQELLRKSVGDFIRKNALVLARFLVVFGGIEI